MYIKLKNGVIDRYPYSVRELIEDNKNTSFPSEIPEERLNEWDVYSVSYAIKPEDIDGKEIVEDIPVFDGEKWIQTWKYI